MSNYRPHPLSRQGRQVTESMQRAAALQQAKEIFVVWPRGTIETVTPEVYKRRGPVPAGLSVFVDREKAEACAAERRPR